MDNTQNRRAPVYVDKYAPSRKGRKTGVLFYGAKF